MVNKKQIDLLRLETLLYTLPVFPYKIASGVTTATKIPAIRMKISIFLQLLSSHSP